MGQAFATLVFYWSKSIRWDKLKVRLMKKVLDEILESGLTKLEGGETTAVHSAIGRREIELIRRIFEEIRPVRTLEVGMAYGISTLTICEALVAVGGQRHIAIDPDQHSGNWGDGWGGGGLANVEKAGFTELLEFYEAPSHIALPKLEAARTRVQFALIDGWPTFDYRIMDFVMVDRLLDIGGIVMIAATNVPAVRKACRFIATNRSYRVYDSARTRHDSLILARVQRQLRGLNVSESIRRHFKPELLEPDEELGLGRKSVAIAFLKEDEDRRRWDYFEEF
jgi:predicted O-methyltransferase YrrM